MIKPREFYLVLNVKEGLADSVASVIELRDGVLYKLQLVGAAPTYTREIKVKEITNAKDRKKKAATRAERASDARQVQAPARKRAKED